jgi:hypothetical protein
MNRIAIVFLSASMFVSAQNFQPPSWGQGTGQGQGQGSGQGAVHSQNAIQQQITQLQGQIEKLRAQQRELSRPSVQTQTEPVTGHPISGKETRQTTQKLTDGTDITHSDTSSFYRDSSGRMRAEGPNGIEIFDPVAQVEYDVAPQLKKYAHSFFNGHVSYVAIAAYGNTTESHIHSGSDNAGKEARTGVTEDLGKQMVNGVMATGSRVTIAIPAGEIGNNREIKVVNERWYSDDLQILVKSINTDPRFGVNVYELTDIKQTEPDISLFKVPADYKLVANPGDLWRRN